MSIPPASLPHYRPDRRRLLIAAAASPMASCAAWQVEPAQAAQPGFEGALQARLLREGVGFAAVQVGPAGVNVHTVGVMHQGRNSPITDQTLFELGSMTKVFVALVFADGVLNRRWSFDDPAEDGLPDGMKLRDAKGQPLRLIDLASHRSGLPRNPGNVGGKELRTPYPFYTEARMFEFLRQWKPEAERGERFEYSNLGYGLLSLLLARRSGLILDRLLAQRVYTPLGLTDLRIRRPLPSGDNLAEVAAALAAQQVLMPREATGHTADRRPAAAWQFDAMAGAVGLVGSITPVGRFMQAALGLYDHPLREAFAMCLQSRSGGEHPLHPFGLGWETSRIVTRSGQRGLFNQDGATAGFSTSVWLEPGRRQGAAVLANAFIETRSLALLGLDRGITEDDFNLVLLPSDALEPLVGSYLMAPRFLLEVKTRGGKLWMHEPGQPEVELLASAARRFFPRTGVLEVAFDERERPRHLTLQRNGEGLTFLRQP